MTEVDLGGQNTFIGAWYLPDAGVCDELIAYFHASAARGPGRVGGGEVDPDVKDSTDLPIDYAHFTDPPMVRYLNGLREVCEQYVGKFQASGAVDAWGITEKINIQPKMQETTNLNTLEKMISEVLMVKRAIETCGVELPCSRAKILIKSLGHGPDG